MRVLKIAVLLGAILGVHVWRWKIFIGSLPLLSGLWTIFPSSDRSALLVSILTGIAMAWIVMLVSVPTESRGEAIRKD